MDCLIQPLHVNIMLLPHQIKCLCYVVKFLNEGNLHLGEAVGGVLFLLASWIVDSGDSGQYLYGVVSVYRYDLFIPYGTGDRRGTTRALQYVGRQVPTKGIF